jgi:cold-inducible RNA-binding protein
MNIYVANIPYSFKDNDLTELFSEFGNVVSAKIIIDRETGNSRGFGFVEMENKEAGNNAIESLNGKDINGRQLKVNEAKPRK